LDDIKTEEEIENLTTKEIKRVLLNNFVDFKGCCEKWELQDRLKRLWRDNETNKKKGTCVEIFNQFIVLPQTPTPSPTLCPYFS